MDYYLSFPDEASANAVLYTEDKPNFANIDTIGVIYKDEQAIPGWHVNVRLVDGEDASIIEPFKVQPATPMRVWG
jgi:hypothetical protein